MAEGERVKKRHQVALFAIGTLLLFVVAMLPFILSSAFEDILGSPQGHIFTIPSTEAAAESPEHFHVRIDIASIDELEQVLILRVSIRRDFLKKPEWNGRVVLFSILNISAQGDLPPSAYADFPSNEFCSSQTIQLPVRGQPLRYPFDSYDFDLGILMQGVYPDGTIETATADQVKGRVYVQLSEHLARLSMKKPLDIDPQKVSGPSERCRYLYVERISLHRPLYLKVLSVLLVLLVAAAASYAVFMRPLSELIVNSGALVLGVWGIRSILVSGATYFVTAVDLALMAVILFLLVAISVRTFQFFKEKCGVSLPWWESKRECLPPSGEHEEL
ncbi:MAG: hypothetical protein RDV48_00155 [Candidatus Eremiobacteraeota bacterium]|nr:hypothetical protein [Candidatus Eremiobacteraeota bacterium]